MIIIIIIEPGLILELSVCPRTVPGGTGQPVTSAVSPQPHWRACSSSGSGEGPRGTADRNTVPGGTKKEARRLMTEFKQPDYSVT